MAVAAATRTVRGSNGSAEATAEHARRLEGCCAHYHHAVELIGKRWSGAILFVMTNGPLRFSEIRHLVPDLSDRLLSERLKELEAEGIVQRRVFDEVPVRVEYELTAKGHALEPVLRDLKSWAMEWVEAPAGHPNGRNGSH
jgi:DNA-binding HxlR family transcriptional regulator